MAEKSNSNDTEMLKWLDVLLEFDPAEDGDVVGLLGESGDLEMHEAAADGSLEEENEK